MSNANDQAVPGDETDAAVAQIARYNALAHAMQSGVAAEMSFHSKPTEPKHLRVGVNTAHVDLAALAALLISKGVFTDLELHIARAEAMKAEVAAYEKRISDKYGRKVSLA